MIGADRAFTDRERPFVDWLSLVKAVLPLIEVAEIVQGARDVDMVAPQPLLTDRQRLLDDGFGIGVAAFGLVDLAEIVEQGCNRALRAGDLLVDRQRPLEQRLGIRVAILPLI